MSKTIKTDVAVLAIVLTAVSTADTRADDSAVHMGVATCAASQCHGSAVPRDGSNVLQNEYVTWTKNDPHSRAYEVLGNEESKRIAARLGLKAATSAPICLDCHADNVAPPRRGERFHLSDGVGCESCHGGAENWLATHYRQATVTHGANLEAGLLRTEDVSQRAEVCLSCHLGTTDKFATHRIMAAGHPRLSFELDTFTELWRTAGGQAHYRVDADYRERKGAASHSYTWAAGLLTESRRRLRLIDAPLFNAEGMFPELAFYDCHSCHRSMKTVRSKSLPRHGGVGPGAPFLQDGTYVMAMALARTVSPADAKAIESDLAELHRAGSDSVLAIQSAAAKLDATLARLQSHVSERNLRGRERQLLREILRTGAEGNYVDYISAEQAYMAVQMLVIEIGDAGLTQQLDPIADTLNNDERFSPAAFTTMLAKLSSPDQGH